MMMKYQQDEQKKKDCRIDYTTVEWMLNLYLYKWIIHNQPSCEKIVIHIFFCIFME